MNSTRERFPVWLILMGALTAVGPLSIDMYLPAFPAVEADIGAGAPLTLASYFVGMAVGQLFYGPVSDRFGRKPPLYFGLSLYTLAAIACVYADSMEWLIATRCLQALGGCAGLVICRAIVRDRCTPQESARAFSLLMLVMGLAPILAPLLGGWLLTVWRWPSIFVFQAGFGFACLLWVYFGLQESHTQGAAHSLALGDVTRTYIRLFGDRDFLTATLAGGLAFTGMFAYIAGSPQLLIEHYELSPQQYAWVFGSNAFGLIAASQINARLLARQSMSDVLTTALRIPVIAAIGLSAAAWTGVAPLWLVLTGLFFYVASLGFIAPNSAAVALAGQARDAGAASALMGSLQFVMASIVGAAMGWWQDGTARPLATVMAICGVGAWFVWRRYRTQAA